MAYQSYRVTGNRRLVPNQGSILEGKLMGLPSMLARRDRQREQADLNEFRTTQLAQERDIADQELDFAEESEKKAFNLELVKTGVNLGTGIASDKTFSEMGSDFKDTFMSGSRQSTTPQPGTSFSAKETTVSPFTGSSGTAGPEANNGGFFRSAGSKLGGLQPGTMVSSGLTGYGVASMFGGKSKEKKMLYGAAGGLLAGLLGGGYSGAISGGIGGLFGGMLA